MGLFRNHTAEILEKQLTLLRTQLTDQQEAYIKLQQTFERERAMLLDKILALSNPTALRESRREPSYSATPRERQPITRAGGFRHPLAAEVAPRNEIRQPQPGRLRPKPPLEEDRPPAQSTPDQAAAEILGKGAG